MAKKVTVRTLIAKATHALDELQGYLLDIEDLLAAQEQEKYDKEAK
jgi:hypothetical protein